MCELGASNRAIVHVCAAGVRCENRWPPLPLSLELGDSPPPKSKRDTGLPMPRKLGPEKTPIITHRITISLLPNPGRCPTITYMRFIAPLLVLVALTAAPLPLRADQEAAPTSVGLSNFSTFTVGTATAIVILPRNTKRAGLIIQNNGSSSVVVKPGSTPSSATDGIVLVAGQIWQPLPPPVDALYGKSASSTDTIVMIENIK